MPVFRAKARKDMDPHWRAMATAMDKYSDGKGFEVVVRRQDKTRLQEEKYHAIIGDIADFGVIEYMGVRVDFNAYELTPREIAKIMLVSWFEDELKSNGMKLRRPGSWFLDPVTKMPIRERAQTRKFTKEEGGWFIEHLMTIVAENRIHLSDKSTAAYEEYKEAQ